MAEIQLKGVTKRYPDATEAVKAMDLDIGDGEFMILVGPSARRAAGNRPDAVAGPRAPGQRADVLAVYQRHRRDVAGAEAAIDGHGQRSTPPRIGSSVPSVAMKSAM